jgi:hypothetical protein
MSFAFSSKLPMPSLGLLLFTMEVRPSRHRCVTFHLELEAES